MANKRYGRDLETEYVAWQSMRRRCYYKKDISYANYGARGITVCERWRNSYENFIADMGYKPYPKMTLERIDNSIGYNPDNCIWASRVAQARNRRSTLFVNNMPLAYWAEHLGLKYHTLYARFRKKGSKIIERLLDENPNVYYESETVEFDSASWRKKSYESQKRIIEKYGVKLPS